MSSVVRPGRLGEALLQPGAARDARRLLGDLVHAAGDDVVDLARVDAAALHDRLIGAAEEVGGVDLSQHALLGMAASDGGADRFDDAGLTAELGHVRDSWPS